MGLGCHELLLLGHRGVRRLNASTKYSPAAMPSRFPTTGEDDKEDVDVGSVDEGSRGRWQA
jgi:hypothetical protein